MKKQEKRESLSRLDAMPTAELQEILRKHINGKLESEPDSEVLFQIMGELSKRRK